MIVVGGGSAGLPAALFAARRGLRVLLVDHAPVLGGSLWVATGQMSAAGTRLQRTRGIEDDANAHFEDVMRISRGTANRALVRLAVDHAADTFDWLESIGFAALPEHPVTGHGHEPYRQARYYWAADGALGIKAVLEPQVMAEVARGTIALRLAHEVVSLDLDEAGAVTGVAATDAAGTLHHFSGGSVVLACGGYAADPVLFEELNGYPQYNAAPYPFGRGAGLRLGAQAGGYARGHENVFINFGTLFDGEAWPARAIGRIEHFPERRQPWEIYVNAEGRRFVREDIPSVDAREMALMDQTAYRYWIVLDAAMLERAPPIVVGWTQAQMAAAFAGDGPTFLTGATIPLLAEHAGIEPGALEKTVRAFNYGVATGNDLFGRQHMPLPIAQSPFYAIRMQASSISSAVGLAVNDSLRVVRKDGSVIPNLYAAGEVLGSSQTMGKAACGGMMVTPALTFGRLLGERLLPFRNER